MSKTRKIPTYRVKLVRDRITLTCREEAHASDLFRQLVKDNSREFMHVLYADGCCNIIGAEMVAMGSGHSLTVTARDVIRGALIAGASGIIVGHNHPSGSPAPSEADITMTRAVLVACKAVGLELLDHIITTEHDGHSSMFGDGILEGLEKE